MQEVLKIYTMQEVEFLENVLKALEIEYTCKELDEPIRPMEFTIEFKVIEEKIAVQSCMKLNYKRNFA